MKLQSIQILRAIAANAVVIAHLTEIERKYAHSSKLLPDWAGVQFAAMGVNLFFVISGFVIAMVAQNEPWRRFVTARFIRIYPIYWFYTTIVLLVFIIRPDVINQSYQHPPSILKSYLLWPEDSFPLLGVGWTLIHEMYFYIVVAASLALGLRLLPTLVAWLTFLVLAPLVFQESWPVTSILLHPLTLEFIAGSGIGIIVQQFGAHWGKTSLIVGLSFLLVGGLAYNFGFAPLDDRWARVIDLGLPFIPIVYGAVAMEARQDWRAFSWISRLGDASYSTYLSHVMTVSLIGRLFATETTRGSTLELTFLSGCLISANVIGLLSFTFLERPAISFLRNRLLPNVRNPTNRAANVFSLCSQFKRQ